MAGVYVKKRYQTTNGNRVNIANNWMVLVFGLTERGTTKPTIIQTYTAFTRAFGQPVPGVLTHAYMRFLLENGVNVLFKRITKSSELRAASTVIFNSQGQELFSVKAEPAYAGVTGNDLAIQVVTNKTTNACALQILLQGEVVESFSLGQNTQNDMSKLVYDFVTMASQGMSSVSAYVSFSLINEDAKAWESSFPMSNAQSLEGGAEPENTKNSAMAQLQDIQSEIYQDVRLLHAMTYYPELRFVTTGGLNDSDEVVQEKILENMGIFATNCSSSFRVLVDYSVEMTNINTVRKFARMVAAKNQVSPSIFAYFGFYGADNNNNYLPGSAGFLTALARAGYNVYNRRIAGTGFMPAFTKPYKEVYIDALTDWQAEDNVQVNPIMIVDAQDNNAVMGSSTLAMPLSSLTARNPQQALDVCCVGDYIAALLNNIALSELEAALNRLSLSSLSDRMAETLERFVASSAITRYNLDFDTTQLGKLGVTCTLFFAIGLEEVNIIVNHVYDTDLLGMTV